MMNQLDNLAVNAVRILSAEAVQKANSGHPGLPMGSAAIAFELWANQMNHNPADPNWQNRDRFVLSAGHGSMLLYSLLHLFGYGLSMEDLQSFRQWNSKTPGHPEYKHTVGVETTTGPLGQGVAMAVGMAMAQAHLAARFNTPEFPIVDHYTYALVGDGCMMEGVEGEAASLAGTLGLGKLIVFYDDNEISIEGNTDIAFQENVGARHQAYGWHVQCIADGNDTQAIANAVAAAKAVTDKPSLIIVATTIAHGSPLAGSHKAHGEPLGWDNIAKTKETLGWTCAGQFEMPGELYAHMDAIKTKLAQKQADWNALYQAYAKANPELAKQYALCMADELPDLVNDEAFWQFSGANATRATSGEIINRLATRMPNLFGGSADLAPSNKSEMLGAGWFGAEDYSGKNIHFGVREFAMACACNGITLHGGLHAYCATFFVFSDYLKAAIRLSALMGIPTMYVLTHDSIGVGEDGPTHEPIEQLAMLRSTPNVAAYRPADGKETAAAYIVGLTRKGPTCIIGSRQNLPTYETTGKGALQGGYILSDCQGTPDVLLMASGSEVELIVKAAAQLQEEGKKVRVVSMPCLDIFEEQSQDYKESVLPAAVRARVAVEAAATMSWYKYTGLDGAVIGLDHFGASAPANILFEQFGFTVQNVVDTAKSVMK